MLDIQSGEIQALKDAKGDLQAKLDCERSHIRHLEHECKETSDFLYRVMSEKDILENQLNRFQTGLGSEKQRAERLQCANDEQTRQIDQLHGELKW
jgi:chromosome segregation ATPase